MDDEYKLDLNSNEMCRNCLAQNCQLKTLFRCDIIDGEIWPIPRVYKNVTEISIAENDGFPQNICTKCELALIDAFMFKQKSLKSHNLLKKVLKVSNEDKIHEDSLLDSLETERQSQSIQTSDIEIMDIKSDVEVDDNRENVDNEEIENDHSDDDENTNNDWQWVYVSENDDNVIEQHIKLKPCENLETGNETPDISSTVAVKLIDMIDCEKCGEQILQNQQKLHQKDHDKILPYLLMSMEYFRCSRCLMTFPYIENLFEHFGTKVPCEQLYPLNTEESCIDYQYLSTDPPIRLLSTSKNVDSNTFPCNLCNLNFLDLFQLYSHFQEEHVPCLDDNPEILCSELIHTCGVCENSFKNLQDCLQHVYFHQAEYICSQDKCEHVTNSFSTLYSHLTLEHSKDEYECIHCSHVANTMEGLKEHQRSTCSARTKKCNVCGKTFFKKSTLAMHMRTHTSERRYNCDSCPKAFLQSNDLANHLRTHTLERPFKCELCDKSFKTIGQRIGHMDTHTTQHNFRCDICEKSFKSARILRGHKRIHDEPKFVCIVCDKKFNRNYHLTLHMKRHDKVSPKKKAK